MKMTSKVWNLSLSIQLQGNDITTWNEDRILDLLNTCIKNMYGIVGLGLYSITFLKMEDGNVWIQCDREHSKHVIAGLTFSGTFGEHNLCISVLNSGPSLLCLGSDSRIH